jgi:hypothetical protein
VEPSLDYSVRRQCGLAGVPRSGCYYEAAKETEQNRMLMHELTTLLHSPEMLKASIPKATVDDPKDMADSSGDIRQIQAHVEGGNLHLSMTVDGIAAPSVDQTPERMKNRYYYYWLLDTDNDVTSGFKNDSYEGNPTNLAKRGNWGLNAPPPSERLRPSESCAKNRLAAVFGAWLGSRGLGRRQAKCRA